MSDKSTELWGGEPEPEEEMVKRIGEVADGVFQVSELHETGGETSFVFNMGLRLFVCV